ncbi:Tuberous sclerosis 2-like protein [Ceratobasidium sp. 370]|nr:Tuberous sclerosis 2-like protein [Ceratobasidium sp. 370]
MSSVEREEERGGWRGGREESRIREGQGRGRERYHHHDEGEGERDGSEYSSRGPPEVPAMVGSAPNPNRSARAFSFLSNIAKRAKPFNLSGGGGGGGGSSSRVGEIGRKGSGVFERPAPDPEPAPSATNTSHALVPFSTAGTFPVPAAPPLTALSTATSSQFTPAIDSLPPQPIEVLLLALTTPPAPEESQSQSLSLPHHPAVLARQLAKQLRNPTNLRGGVGASMPGARGSALVSAGILGDVVRCLRKSCVGGGVMWDIVGAWVEGDTSNTEIAGRQTDAEAGTRRGGTAIERALLWSALTEGQEGGEGVFDPDEWAERDRTARALTDGGRDILGLQGFVSVIGGWVDVACSVITASHAATTTSHPSSLPAHPNHEKASSTTTFPLPVYVQAQKAIDASLRLLESVLKHNAPRFGERDVVQVVGIFCRAVARTIGPWDAGENLAGVGMGNGSSTAEPKEGIAGKDEKGRINQTRTTHRRQMSSLSSPLASPTGSQEPPPPPLVNRPTTQAQDPLSAPYVVTASRFVALVRALQKWTHVPPQVLQMMLDHLSLVLAYVKTPMDVLRLGGRRKSGAGLGAGGNVGKGEVDWVDAYSRIELEGEVSGAFKVLLAGPYAVAVGRMLLALLVPPSGEDGDEPLTRHALVSLGASRAIRLSVREAAIPRMARMRFQREPASWTMSGAPSMVAGSVSDHVSPTHVPGFKSHSGFFGSLNSSRRGSTAGIDTNSAGTTPNLTTPNMTTPNMTVIVSDVAEMELMELMFNKDSDGASGAWETDRIVGVLGAAFSTWVASVMKLGAPGEAVLIEMLGIVDDLVQEAAEDEKAFGIEEGRVVGEVIAAAVQLLSIYGPGHEATRILDITAGPGVDSPSLSPVLQTLAAVIRKIGLSTPINPPLISTLFGKSVYLTDHSAVAIIRHHVAMSLVTPSTPAYLDNLRQLVEHFYKPNRPLARIELAQVIAKLYFGSSPEVVSPTSEGRTRTRDSSPTPMMTLLNVLTPTMRAPRELPPETGPAPKNIPVLSPPSAPPTCVEHVGDCKAMAAVVTLIQAFTALAFSPPHSLSTAERTARAPASFQCILVMRDLLALLSPVRGDTLDPDEEAAEERSRIIDGQSCCSFARLAVLQWLVRLRADRDHRLYMVKDLDKEVEPFASLINRTPQKPKSNDAPPVEPARVRERERDRDRRNRGMTTTANTPDTVRTGRNLSRGRASDSRSRSRQPPPARAQPPARYSIWSVPDTLPFEVSFGTRPSEGMTTYEQRIEPGEDGLIPQLWLPVSAYVCIMIDLITTETDWEILSYALCHLPLQMSNKHLFCGPRTRNAIIRLLSQLCTVVHDDKLTKNIGSLPSGLKVTDVQGLAYHTLTTLMSYHRTFDKRLQDALLQTFLRGLNKNTTTVKPCLQALSVAAFELQPSMTKFLGEIVDKLSQIMSNPTIAGYILELLCIIGSLPSLYANFTDDNYRRVDEPTEVCFDWLARFTYANAEPKPRMSSLREGVLNPPGSIGDGVISSKSWVFGNSIITIKTLRHSGWLEIECRRPSGLSTFLCKLENIASLGLGEQVTGEIVEAATGGMSREPSGSLEPWTTQPAPNDEQPPSEGMVNPNSTPSGILSPSGVAAPKEMELDPSYFALQLSPYPDIRRASLRGRLIPNDDLLSRTLRGLDRVPVMDLHTVGILYVGPGQTDEREILGNRAGSPAYTQFLDNLGRLIRLKDQRDLYTGGLDSHYDGDGQYAYAWWDVIGQILYHTATLMPNREGDEQFASKKLHIGNDYVRIVWNDSGKPYRFDTLSTQFQYVNIVIQPHSLGAMAAYTSTEHQDEFFKVVLQRAPGMPEFGMIGEFKIVSAKCLPNVIRQVSMLANFFAQIYVHTQHDTVREEYITPWRQRLRQIRMFKSRLPALATEEPADGILGQELARDFSRSY